MTQIYIDSWNEGFGHLLGRRDLTAERVDRMRIDITQGSGDWRVVSNAQACEAVAPGLPMLVRMIQTVASTTATVATAATPPVPASVAVAKL